MSTSASRRSSCLMHITRRQFLSAVVVRLLDNEQFFRREACRLNDLVTPPRHASAATKPVALTAQLCHRCSSAIARVRLGYYHQAPPSQPSETLVVQVHGVQAAPAIKPAARPTKNQAISTSSFGTEGSLLPSHRPEQPQHAPRMRVPSTRTLAYANRLHNNTSFLESLEPLVTINVNKSTQP